MDCTYLVCSLWAVREELRRVAMFRHFSAPLVGTSFALFGPSLDDLAR